MIIPENCELVVDMVEECPKNSPKDPDKEEDAQLPDLIGGIGKGTKVEKTPIAQLARNPFEDGEDHVQGEALLPLLLGLQRRVSAYRSALERYPGPPNFIQVG